MPQPSAYPNLDRVLIVPDLNDEPPLPRPVPFSQIPSEPVGWLWPNRIPLGKLTLLVGPPGVGKGLVSLDLAARITRGEAWPTTDSPAPCGTVFLLHADDDPSDVVAQRLKAAGADLEKAITFQRPTSVAERSAHRFSLSRDLPAIRSALEAAADSHLIIIDPISAFVPTTGFRGHQAQVVLQALLDLAQSHRLALLAVENCGSRNKASIGRVPIAPCFLRAASSILSVIKDPKDPARRLLLSAKSNLAADQPPFTFRPTLPDGNASPRIQWDAEPLTLTPEDLNPVRLSAAERQAQDELDHITLRLKEKLSEGPQSYFWLRIEFPGTEQQQYRAADRLGIIKAKGCDSSWYWMLPEQFPKWQAEQEERRAAQKRDRQERKNRRRRRARAVADAVGPSRANKI